MISDTQSLTVTRDQIGLKTRSDEGPVSVKYTLGSEGNSNGNCGVEYFNEDGIMSTFRMRTLDAMYVAAAVLRYGVTLISLEQIYTSVYTSLMI